MRGCASYALHMGRLRHLVYGELASTSRTGRLPALRVRCVCKHLAYEVLVTSASASKCPAQDVANMPFAYGALASKPFSCGALVDKRLAYGAQTGIYFTYGVSVNKKCAVY